MADRESSFHQRGPRFASCRKITDRDKYRMWSKRGSTSGRASPGPHLPIPASGSRGIHRIGGASVENLRLKPRSGPRRPRDLRHRAPTAKVAANEMRTGLPKAKGAPRGGENHRLDHGRSDSQRRLRYHPHGLHALPNHHRIIHPEGVAGFNDENLARLAEVFVNTTGH